MESSLESATLDEHQGVGGVHPIDVSVDEVDGRTPWVLTQSWQSVDQRLPGIGPDLEDAVESIFPRRWPQEHLVQVVPELQHFLLVCQPFHPVLHVFLEELLGA